MDEEKPPQKRHAPAKDSKRRGRDWLSIDAVADVKAA